VGHRQSFYQQAIKSAARSHDPFQKIEGSWLIRRLSPESNPIEIADLPQERDEETLLYAMGSEALQDSDARAQSRRFRLNKLLDEIVRQGRYNSSR
jgi:hypothetical protein